MQPDFHNRRRGAQDASSFCGVAFFEIAQHENHSIGLGQSGDRLADDAGGFLALEQGVAPLPRFDRLMTIGCVGGSNSSIDSSGLRRRSRSFMSAVFTRIRCSQVWSCARSSNV